MSRLFFSIVFATSITLSMTSHADLRCNTRIVQKGDSMDEVLDKCGDPNRRYNQSIIYRRAIYGAKPYREEVAEQALVDVWVYKPSRGQFRRSVYFAYGEVIDIRLGDRVD